MSNRRLSSGIVKPFSLGALALFAGVLASGCSSNSAAALGHRACAEVAKSLELYHKSETEYDAKLAASNRVKAMSELATALHQAALAAASDTAWQALEATLSESSRVPEGLLVPALTAQCSVTLHTS